MKYTKHQLTALILTPLLFLSALAVYVFWLDYTISILIVTVWVNMFLLRSAFPKYFSGKYSLYVINFLALFALLNIGTLLYDQYLDYKLAQFDINHDLVFSPEEQTVEQQMYMASWVNDVGRNFMPITALFISLGSSLLLFFGVKLFRLWKGWKGGSHAL